MKGSYLRGLPAFLTLHSFSVTFFTLGFFNPVANIHTRFHEGYPSNSFIGFSTHHSICVTLFALGFRPLLFN